MTPNEYQLAALRTEVTPSFVNDHEGRPSRSLSRLLHALLGMNTEQAELHAMLNDHVVLGEPFDGVNVVEECGDQLWYIGLGLDALELTMDDAMVDINFQEYLDAMRTTTPSYIAANGSDIQPTTMSRIFRGHAGINIAQGDFADLYKKFFIYGKAVDKDALRQTFGRQLLCIQLVLHVCGYTLEDAMKRNIAKLEKRYPQKFTQELALNRDLPAERAVLEGNDNES